MSFVILQWILHDRRDECCLKILKSCHKALPDSGKVKIAEFPEAPITRVESRGLFHTDMLMLAFTPYQINVELL